MGKTNRTAYMTAYRKDKAEKVRAINAAYYLRNKDKIDARTAAYNKANPDKVKLN